MCCSASNGVSNNRVPGNGMRLSRLRSAIAEAGADVAYVRDTANIEWVTGFRGVFDDERAHALLISRDGVLADLHTDSRYSAAMEREAADSPFKVNAEPASMSSWARGAIAQSGCSCASLAIEDTMPLREYRALEAAFREAGQGACGAVSADAPTRFCVSLIETSDLALRLRAVKDPSEVEAMRRAQAITDAAFDHILGFIAPGKTEREVQLELDDFMMRNGAETLAFASIVASGANGASPHAIVTDKPIERGECIVMDFGARAGGYCSDMTRTVFMGQPDDEMRRAWDALRRANEMVEAKLSVGMTGRAAHELALSVLADGGFADCMGHGLGHGVGVEIHELPVLSPRNDEPLVEGNVVTVEPGIYIPGKFGMRLEDCGVLTASGFERFTQSTHEMVVV